MRSPLLSLLARARAMGAPLLDGVLVGLLVVVTGLEAGLAEASAGARAAVVLPLGLVAAGVLLRRREPLAAVAVANVGIVSAGLLAFAVWESLNVIYLALLFVTYSMAGRESGRRLVAGVVIALAGISLASLTFADRTPDSPLAGELLLGAAFFVLAPVVAGRLLHGRERLSTALREKTAVIEADRAGRAQEAAAAERARIAGELHDVVAHALSAMTIQATGARRLATVKPDRAAEAFAAIEVAGREALAELRTLLDALRDDEGPEPLHAPQPSLDELAALAGRARAQGLGVALEVSGARPPALPAGIDVTAYRIVQEALSAALHQGGAAAAAVNVRYRGDRLEVEIVDDGVHDDGRRLLGLHERVSLYGGEVQAGCEDAGGHAVRAWLPLEVAA